MPLVWHTFWDKKAGLGMLGLSLVGIGERMRECVSVLKVEEVQFYCQFCTSNEAGLGEPMSRASAQKK